MNDRSAQCENCEDARWFRDWGMMLVGNHFFQSESLILNLREQGQNSTYPDVRIPKHGSLETLWQELGSMLATGSWFVCFEFFMREKEEYKG